MTDDDKALVERLFAMADEYDSGHHESWPTIDALEIAANRIEALSAENERLRGLVQGWHYLAVGPDEMGDYYTQKQLIKASEPYAHPARAALGETK